MKYLNLIAFGLMVYMNYLANAMPINGKTTGQLSAQYPNLFVPAGITFSIWGVIYLLLAGFCVMQFSSQHKGLVQSLGWLFLITCLLNSAWIVAWHYEQLPLSVLIMSGLLVALILINIRLTPTSNNLIKIAFGIYLGWICIAMIANMTAWLVNLNWGALGLSEQAWAMIMILIGSAIAIMAVIRLNNPFVGLAVIWALTGIILKRQSDFVSIVIVATIGIATVAVTTGWIFFRKIQT